jgi:AcrR family transcriptional regulator
MTSTARKSPGSTTRARILDSALRLFNARGERNVTTNHIAEDLGISPGNLYYHFRNKADIVSELFNHYETLVSGFLQVPADRVLTWQDKMGYLESILDSMWGARFFHRDLSHLLNQDDDLRQRYNTFVQRTLEQGLRVYEGLRSAGLLEASDEELRALMVNTWVITASWTGFVHGLVPPDKQHEELDHTLLRQGIYQLVCLEAPYLRGDAAGHLAEIKQRYSAGDTLSVLFSAATPQGTAGNA